MSLSVARICSFVVVFVGALSGCAGIPHRSLATAPTATEPYEVRAAYYKAHSPDAFADGVLRLHDGTSVYYPEDLAPAVAPASPTASAIKRYQKAEADLEPMTTMTLVSSGAMLGGLAIGSGALLGGTIALAGESPELGVVSLIALAASGVALTGGAVGATVAPIVYSDQLRERADAAEAAVSTFAQSLSDQTGIQPDADGHLRDLAEAQAPRTSDATL